jgi:hypothetical protein
VGGGWHASCSAPPATDQAMEQACRMQRRLRLLRYAFKAVENL